MGPKEVVEVMIGIYVMVRVQGRLYGRIMNVTVACFSYRS